MTDTELIKELNHLAFIYERLGDLRKAALIKNTVARLVEKRREPTFIKINNIDISDDVRRAMKSGTVVLTQSTDPQVELILDYPTIINDFKSALLKKIFPYDAVDKKQYSINAYAVERAIIEVAEEMIGGKYDRP